MTNDLKNFINTHNNFLIIAGDSNSYDSICAAFALAMFLDKAGKNATVHTKTSLPEKLNFLNLQKYSSAHGNNMKNSVEAVLAVNTHYKHPNVPNLTIQANTEQGCASEMLTRAFKEINAEEINKNMATCLLAGIISATKNFQSPAIGPQTMFASAYLISKKADNEKIVRELYKIKPAEFIKLWGLAISRFNYNPITKIGWTYLDVQDITKSGANLKHIPWIINELKTSFSDADIYAVGFQDTQQKSFAIAHSKTANNLYSLANSYNTQIKNNSVLVSLENIYDIKTSTFALIKHIERSFRQ